MEQVGGRFWFDFTKKGGACRRTARKRRSGRNKTKYDVALFPKSITVNMCHTSEGHIVRQIHVAENHGVGPTRDADPNSMILFGTGENGL
jgi:hypothetical protein